MTPAITLPYAAAEAGRQPAWLRLLLRRESHLVILLAMTVAMVSVVNPAFRTPGNLRDVLVNASPTAIVACGVTLVIVTGEIDISIGSLLGLLSAVLGVLTSQDRMALPVPLAAGVILALGASVGLVNGLLVTLGRVPSIIVTLGMLTALRGVTELVMAGRNITGLPPDLSFLGHGALAGVPICLWVAGAVILASVLLANHTPLGRRIYAVGSNPRAAELLGLPSRRIKVFAFTLTGLLTAVAALVSTPQLSVIDPGIGKGFELLVVTCVVVGGTSINGGVGTIAGSLLGVLLLSIVPTVLIFMRLGVSATYWKAAIQGAFILAAVLADHVVRRRSIVEEGS